jgi:hypothetical protein
VLEKQKQRLQGNELCLPNPVVRPALLVKEKDERLEDVVKEEGEDVVKEEGEAVDEEIIVTFLNVIIIVNFHENDQIRVIIVIFQRNLIIVIFLVVIIIILVVTVIEEIRKEMGAVVKTILNQRDTVTTKMVVALVDLIIAIVVVEVKIMVTKGVKMEVRTVVIVLVVLSVDVIVKMKMDIVVQVDIIIVVGMRNGQIGETLRLKDKGEKEIA